MNALTILLLVVTVIYLTIYQRGFWAYYFGILIPYYIITQIILCDFKWNGQYGKSLYRRKTSAER